MSENKGKELDLHIENNNEQEINFINLEDIPEDKKELIKCSNCGNDEFRQTMIWYKILTDKGPMYTNIIKNTCIHCEEILPDHP